ncbi:MAG: hypothetical protein OXE73_09395 [Gammaproteobacteria bacterium]|nr:hypothetical protein [Gammaproteobacteria bacterium]
MEAKGLFDSLYTDRGSHYWHTPEAGGKVYKDNPTQFGRAMAELGIGMIAAYCRERVPEGLLATLRRGVHSGAEGAGARVLAPGRR